MTKLKNSNCDKTQKLKFLHNSITEINTQKKKKMLKKIQKLKLWQYSETQILTNLKNSNCDQTEKNQIVTKAKPLNCDKT